MGQIKSKNKLIKVLLIIGIVIILLALGVFILLKLTFLKTFPKLKGKPEIGKWYEVEVDGAKSSDGSEWHGIFRKGTENKVVVYFFGGGVSITPETSEGGTKFFATTLCLWLKAAFLYEISLLRYFQNAAPIPINVITIPTARYLISMRPSAIISALSV